MRFSEPLRPAPTRRYARKRTHSPALRAATMACLSVLCMIATGAARAQDLGVIGPVYAIAEPSLIEVIRARLQEIQENGTLERLQHESQARIAHEIEQPAPVAGIGRAKRARSFFYDPSIEIPDPITDATGRVIVAPGTRVNPLDTVSLSRPLLFLDARDGEQVDRARRLLGEHHGQLKLILTGGSYLELMRRLKRPVFFDQQGQITAKLGIRHVPALVTQEGRRLRIDELL